MSPMYGYEINRGPVNRQKEFVEVVLSDSTSINKETGSDVMNTAVDNPCYQSSDDLSNENKVDFSLLLFLYKT